MRKNSNFSLRIFHSEYCNQKGWSQVPTKKDSPYWKVTLETWLALKIPYRYCFTITRRIGPSGLPCSLRLRRDPCQKLASIFQDPQILKEKAKFWAVHRHRHPYCNGCGRPSEILLPAKSSWEFLVKSGNSWLLWSREVYRRLKKSLLWTGQNCWYQPTGPAQSAQNHPPSSFSPHQAIIATIVPRP